MDQQGSTSTSSTSVSQATENTTGVTFGATMPADMTKSPRKLASKTLPLGLEHFTASLPGGQELGLPAGAMTKSPGEPSAWWRRTRMRVALLGLTIAVVNCYAQATFCMAIVEMVYPADYISRPGEQTNLLTNVTLSKLAGETVTLQDHSCPIEFKYRDFYDASRFPDESKTPALNSSQQVDLSNRFPWDATQQGLLLGAFAFGTAPLQIVAGRLSEIYGSKWVLLAGCVGTAITNLAIPRIARFSFPLLLANRVLMGVTQAGMEPGVMCLLADWLTPQEASFFISMSLFAICVGFFLGLLGSSLILGLGCSWPMAFYVSGGLNLVVGLVWWLYADSWPHASKHIGQSELEFIAREQRKTKRLAANDLKSNISASPPPAGAQNHMASVPARPPAAGCLEAARDDPVRAPWLNILTTRSVWAFIICKISVRWCADVISNMMPTYLASVLHLSININGLFNSISQALFMLSALAAGWLANEIFLADKSQAAPEPASSSSSSRRKTRVRKAFQSMASFGSTICLVLMTLYDCDIVFSMSMLLVLSCCLVMGSGGELQIPYDMTSRYPGTLHGMACTLSVSGWLAPPLIGLVLGDQPNSRFRWSIVWNSTAALTLIGGLAFVLFADSSPRDFDRKRPKRAKKTPSGADLEEAHGWLAGAASEEGYVNEALNSSSCENSPRVARDNCAPNSAEITKIGSATGVGQGHKTNRRPVDFNSDPDHNRSLGSLKGESNFTRTRTREPELVNGGGSFKSGRRGKTIAPLVSSSTLIGDHQQAERDAPGATMINDARGETGAEFIVRPNSAERLTDGPANERVAITPPDLRPSRASSTLVASNVEQAPDGATHKAADQPRASLDAAVEARLEPPPDSRNMTHL